VTLSLRQANSELVTSFERAPTSGTLD